MEVLNIELTTFAKSHPIALGHAHFSDHTGFQDKIETQYMLYLELKKELFRFSKKAM